MSSSDRGLVVTMSKPDFLAQFPDGVVTVEAVSPAMDRDIADEDLRLPLRVIAGDRFAADTRLTLDTPIAPAQFEQRQNASLVGHPSTPPFG